VENMEEENSTEILDLQIKEGVVGGDKTR